MISPIRSAFRPRNILIAIALAFSSFQVIELGDSLINTADWCDDPMVTTFGILWFPALYMAQAAGVRMFLHYRQLGRTMAGVVVAIAILAATSGLLYAFDTDEVQMKVCCKPVVENDVTF